MIYLIISTLAYTDTKPVQSVDLDKYSGKWYVIATIPTRLDKGWNYTTESYSVRQDGNIDVFTTYIKEKDTETSILTSKGFPDAKTNNVSWKVQFVWPFKADYLIEELPDDYSYVVVGHPKKKFLYIMSRKNKMSNELYISIVERCIKKGYDIGKLRKVLQ